MPYTDEANEAGNRLNERPWWAGDTIANLADGKTSDANDPVVLTCTREQTAQITLLLTYAGMVFDMELNGEGSAQAVDLAVLVGDQLFPLTEQEVGQAIQDEAQHEDANA